MAAKLIVTVAKLTEQKPKYSAVHTSVAALRLIVETGITPQLLDLFQRDAEIFDDVIKARVARDSATDEKERRRQGELALASLRAATEIPLQIAEVCVRLIDHGVTMFDSGFQGARGDTGAAVSAAVAGAMSAIFVINLNLKSFRGGDWARQKREQCDALHQLLTQKQTSAFERVTTLRTEQINSMGLDFGTE